MPQVVIVSSLGPQGPVGPQGLQGLTGSMAESNSGSFAITGSLTVSGSSTFTNIGPAVFSGSSNFTSLTASSALISGNVTVSGTASINTLIVNQTQLSTGSNQLGDAANDTQTLYGTVRIPTGSLTVSGSSYFTGNVGIGTANPSFILDVVGNTRTNLTSFASQFKGDGGYANSNAFSFSGNGNIGMYFPSNVNLGFSTSGSERMRIDSSGSVGIGTTTPSYTLDISGSLRVGTPTATPHLIFARASNNYITTPAGGAILFNLNNSATENTSIVSIYSTGLRVGTGFANPSAVTHVRGSGTTNATTALLVQNSNASASLTVLDNGYVGIGTAAPSYSLDVYGSYHQYQVQGQLARYDISSANANQNRGVWDFYTNVAVAPDFFGRFGFKFEGGVSDSFKQYQVHIGDSTTPKFIVDGAGRVAIGTITPSASLHISGSSGSILFEIDSNSQQNILYVSGSGNIGVGTSTPNYKLDISGSTFARKLIVGSDAGFTGAISQSDYYQRSTTSGTVFVVRDVNNNNMVAASGASGTSLFSVTTQNIGLGTPSSTAKVQILGNGTTSATTTLRVENSSASPSLTITDDLTSRFFGNVGIGALPASGSLHISGAASTSSAAVYIYKSGSTTLDIQGSQGQLFSVTDALSGSLMSVNDISGLPILEVFSDDRVVMGSFSQPALLVTGSAVRFPATASTTPTYTGSEGQVVFGVVGGNAFIYAWLGGRWRSGSLA